MCRIREYRGNATLRRLCLANLATGQRMRTCQTASKGDASLDQGKRAPGPWQNLTLLKSPAFYPHTISTYHFTRLKVISTTISCLSPPARETVPCLGHLVGTFKLDGGRMNMLLIGNIDFTVRFCCHGKPTPSHAVRLHELFRSRHYRRKPVYSWPSSSWFSVPCIEASQLPTSCFIRSNAFDPT